MGPLTHRLRRRAFPHFPLLQTLRRNAIDAAVGIAVFDRARLAGVGIGSLRHARWPSIPSARSLQRVLAGIAAVIYLGLFASVMAYAMWGTLLRKYSTGTVAPFALLAPCVGAGTSSFVFGETFGPVRLAGILAMLSGLAIVALPSSVFVSLRNRFFSLTK